MCKKLIYLVSFVLVLGPALTNVVNAGRPGLVGYWRLNEGTGTIGGDVSGNGNNGTLNGGAKWTQGKYDGGVYLDGQDDYIEIPNVISAAGTMEFWFKPDWDGSDPADYRLFDASLGGIYFFVSKGANHADINPEDFGFYLEDATDADYQGIEIDPAGVIFADTWFHVAVTWQFGGGPAILYIDGKEVSRADTLGPLPALYANPRFGLQTIDYIPSANGAKGIIDEIAIFNRALAGEEIQTTMAGLGEYLYAWGPNPDDGTLYPDTWISLSWSAGDTAVSHDVYIGDNFDDVNDGAAETFRGNQVAMNFIVGFPGFPYPDGLVPGTTYYWRIDEVEADGTTIHKGPVWSFGIPPRTAYAPNPADSAELVAPDVQLSWTPGFGAKLHHLYFGNNFADVNNGTTGTYKGPVGFSKYTPGTLKLSKTYYWRVDEFDAVVTHKGHVWSFTTQGAVVSLNPSNGAVDVKQTPVLAWSPGVYAASHQVYFGADKDAVKNAGTGSPEYKGTRNLGSESYDPGKLLWDATYYWRIDEVNNANADSPWKGPVWSFTTANFLVVDDFEDYDVGNNEIWWSWKDGLGYAAHGNEPAYPGNGTGAAVGDESTASYTEETIVHGGSQSMPLFYDNSVLKYSEAQKTLTYPRDWTEKGVNTLTIWFRGNSANAAETLYVALNGNAVVSHDNPKAAQIATWTRWNIDLQAFADQGVNLANVNTIALGLGNKKSPVAGGSGTMYFDDIGLYPMAP